MSSTQKKTDTPDALDADAVAAYLAEHPEFFVQRPELVASLTIPHECGDSISLLEYQARILRDNNRKLRQRLDELLDVARDNDRVAERMHRLTLELLQAENLDAALLTLKDCLRTDFEADATAIRLLVAPEHAQQPELVSTELPELDLFSANLRDQRPVCGRLTRAQTSTLFGDCADDIGSTALVPIVDGGTVQGLLAIGSLDAERFTPNQGTVFLRRLGSLVGRAIRSHLPR